MNNQLLRELQEYHYSLKDIDGHWRKNPVGFIYNAHTSIENIKIVREILTIIMDSDDINIETKVYVASKGMSIRGVNEAINQARSMKKTKDGKILKALSYNNTCLKLAQDNEALNQYLGNRILRDIVYEQVKDIKITNKKLKQFKERYGESHNYRDNLDLDINDKLCAETSYVNNPEFFDILQSLESYLVQRKEIVEQALNMNEEFISYFNYLLSKKSIGNDKVQKDKERLIKFLKNEDYITGYTYDEPEEEVETTKLVMDMESGVRKITSDEIEIDDEDRMRLDNYTMLNYDIANQKIDDTSTEDDGEIEW